MVLILNKIIIPITKEIVLLVGTNWILPVVAFHHISWIKNKNIKIYIYLKETQRLQKVTGQSSFLVPRLRSSDLLFRELFAFDSHSHTHTEPQSEKLQKDQTAPPNQSLSLSLSDRIEFHIRTMPSRRRTLLKVIILGDSGSLSDSLSSYMCLCLSLCVSFDFGILGFQFLRDFDGSLRSY